MRKWMLLAGMACAAVVYAASAPLIEVEELKKPADKVRIVDVRPPEEFQKGHIPGAVNRFSRTLDNQDANRSGLPLPLEEARALFRELGIDGKTPVVVYDGFTGPAAARFFYVAEFFGHKRVRVLNGGWAAWVAAGGAQETEARTVPAGKFNPKPNKKRIATAEWLRERMDKGKKITVLDARTPEEYSGKTVTGGGRGGHIPGAVHLDWRETTTENGRGLLKQPPELRALVTGRGVDFGRDTVAYCTIGQRASQLYLVLRLLGHNKIRNYDGSWADWGARPDFPAEK